MTGGSGPAWRMVVHTGQHQAAPSPDRVRAALASLPREAFVVLENAADPDDQIYLQVLLRANGVYQVEHRLGSPESHSVALTVSLDKVCDVVTSWIDGDDAWRTLLDWTPLADSTWAQG